MPITRTLLTLAVALAFIIPPSQAQERRQIPDYREINIEPDSPVQAELHAFLDAYGEGWASEDTDALMALHLEDTEWINAFARMFTSSDALGIFLETRLFPAFDAQVSRQEAENMTLISLRRIGETAAVAHLYTDSQRGPSAIEGQAARRTHFHLVLSREPEGWKIAHTVIMDARD